MKKKEETRFEQKHAKVAKEVEEPECIQEMPKTPDSGSLHRALLILSLLCILRVLLFDSLFLRIVIQINLLSGVNVSDHKTQKTLSGPIERFYFPAPGKHPGQLRSRD